MLKCATDSDSWVNQKSLLDHSDSNETIRKPQGQILQHRRNGQAFSVSMLSMLAWKQGSTEALWSSHNGWPPFLRCKEIFLLVPAYIIYCFPCFLDPGGLQLPFQKSPKRPLSKKRNPSSRNTGFAGMLPPSTLDCGFLLGTYNRNGSGLPSHLIKPTRTAVPRLPSLSGWMRVCRHVCMAVGIWTWPSLIVESLPPTLGPLPLESATSTVL